MEDVILQVNHLSKSFGSHEVLRDIDFTVAKGDVTSIIGASGSGKSTLLRCINLLETPTSGEVCYHGKNVAGRGINAPAYRAHVGMVFQSFNLFNNMTVLENCMTGPVTVAKKSKKEARDLAIKFLKKVGMEQYINAKPRQLSGGQKQRVAIARALAMNPDVMLFGDGEIVIGDNVDIGNGTIIYSSKDGGVTIGNDTMIAGQCYIIDMDHGISADELIRCQHNSVEPVTIGNDCWIAAGCKDKVITLKIEGDEGRNKNIANATQNALRLLRNLFQNEENEQ